MADSSEKPLETEEGRTESVEAEEDKRGPDTAPEQSETQEKDAKGQDRDPNLEEKPVEKPVEEKEAEIKPVTRGSKEQDSETTTPKEQKEDKDKEGEEDEEETQAVIHYEYDDMYSKPIVSSLPQDTLQFLYPPLI